MTPEEKQKIIEWMNKQPYHKYADESIVNTVEFETFINTMPEESEWDIIQQYRSNKQQGLVDELRHMENQIAMRKIEECLMEQHKGDLIIANRFYKIFKDWLDREEE